MAKREWLSEFPVNLLPVGKMENSNGFWTAEDLMRQIDGSYATFSKKETRTWLEEKAEVPVWFKDDEGTQWLFDASSIDQWNFEPPGDWETPDPVEPDTLEMDWVRDGEAKALTEDEWRSRALINAKLNPTPIRMDSSYSKRNFVKSNRSIEVDQGRIVQESPLSLPAFGPAKRGDDIIVPVPKSTAYCGATTNYANFSSVPCTRKINHTGSHRNGTHEWPLTPQPVPNLLCYSKSPSGEQMCHRDKGHEGAHKAGGVDLPGRPFLGLELWEGEVLVCDAHSGDPLASICFREAGHEGPHKGNSGLFLPNDPLPPIEYVEWLYPHEEAVEDDEESFKLSTVEFLLWQLAIFAPGAFSNQEGYPFGFEYLPTKNGGQWVAYDWADRKLSTQASERVEVS
jgi:hypothetical protein